MLYLGCSQWGNNFFRGIFYPEDAKSKDYLNYYSEGFDCVELNSTYHDKVEIETFLNWRSKVNSEFRFCPKFPKTISHDQRLLNIQELTEEFINSVKTLKQNLGICFLQLPPNFHPSNIYLIDELLSFINNRIKVSFEIRKEWLSNPEVLKDCFEVLKKHNAGIVMVDGADTIPYLNNLKLTNSTALIRFLSYNHPTDIERVNDWINLIKFWQDKGLKEIYFMLHFPDKTESIKIINYTREKFKKDLGWKPEELRKKSLFL